MGTYMMYYSSLGHFDWLSKTKKRRVLTLRELGEVLWKLLSHIHLCSIVLSVALHFNYQPFASNIILAQFSVSWDIFSPAHLGNAYLLALLTYFVIAFAFEMACFGGNLNGFYTKPVFDNPMLGSSSPPEFWGRRWNLVIHRTLKQGIYLPAKQFFPTYVAASLAFLFSGLLHDYAWTLMFYKHDDMLDENGVCSGQHGCHTPIVFKVTTFFLWNAGVMILERRLGDSFSVCAKWPTFVVSTLVVLTALPVSHWFTGDWARGGYFDELSIGLWCVRQIYHTG